MPRLCAFVLILFSVSSTRLAAGVHDYAGPHRLTWCASLFEAAPSSTGAYRGDLHYYLRGLGGVAHATALDLANRKLNLKEQVGRVLNKFDRLARAWILLESEPHKDLTQPHDMEIQVNFEDTRHVPWTYQNKLKSQRLVGRLAQLESDFTSEAAGNLTFGYSVQGKENIRAYIKEVSALAAGLESEMEPELDRKFPFFTTRRSLSLGIWGAVYAGLTYWVAEDLASSSHQLSVLLPVVTALDLTVFRYAVWPRIEALGFYLLGNFGGKMRDRFDRKYDAHRIGDLIASEAQLKSLNTGTPNTLIYSGYQAPIVGQFKTEFLQASKDKRELNSNLLGDAIGKLREGVFEVADLHFLLVDQMFFFDEATGEPVLTTFVRLKRSLILPPKNKQKRGEKEAAPSWQKETVPGLAG